MMISIGTLGNMLAATPLAALVSVVGWRVSFAMIAVAILGLCFITFRLLSKEEGLVGSRATSSSPEDALPFRQALLLLVKNSTFWLCSFLSFFRYGTFVALQGLWGGPYLREVMGFSPIVSGNILVCFSVGAVLGATICGRLSDRVFKTRKWVLAPAIGCFTLTFLGLTGIAPFKSVGAMAGLFFTMAFFGSTGVIAYGQTKEVLPKQMAGLSMTSVNLFNMAGAAIIMHLLGFIIQHYSGSSGVYSPPAIMRRSGFASGATWFRSPFISSPRIQNRVNPSPAPALEIDRFRGKERGCIIMHGTLDLSRRRTRRRFAEFMNDKGGAMRARVLVTIAAIVAIQLLFTCAFAFEGEERFIKAGDKIPTVGLAAPDSDADRRYLGLGPDRSFRISDIRASVVLVEIMNVYCGSCQAQASFYNKLFLRLAEDPAYRDRVKMIGVAVGNGDAEVAKFKKEFDVRFPVVGDPYFVMYRAVGETPTPYSIYTRLDPQAKSGSVVQTHLGVNRDYEGVFADLKKAVEAAPVYAKGEMEAEPKKRRFRN